MYPAHWQRKAVSPPGAGTGVISQGGRTEAWSVDQKPGKMALETQRPCRLRRERGGPPLAAPPWALGAPGAVQAVSVKGLTRLL